MSQIISEPALDYDHRSLPYVAGGLLRHVSVIPVTCFDFDSLSSLRDPILVDTRLKETVAKLASMFLNVADIEDDVV